MKILFSTTVLVFLGICSVRSQSTNQDNSPSFSIILKVKDVSSAITLSSERQLAFTRFFQQEEEAYSNAAQNGLSAQQINTLKNQLTAEFRALLTPKEFGEYSLKRKGAIYAKPDTITRKY